MRTKKFSDRLLDWYDHHARDLPWRIGPKQKQTGTKPDPYHVYLSEIMLQQTTVATVKPYFNAFLSRWPTISALACANIDDIMSQWAGLGYYSRARNLHLAAKQIMEEHNGQFPVAESQLKKLKGVGDYTAAAIAAIAFDQRAVVIDGNVDRVIVRHEHLTSPISAIKAQIRNHADTRTPAYRPGDYAQAMMDLGATLCTATNPQCLLCPVSEDCKALAHGAPNSLPVKKNKQPKPVKAGIMLIIINKVGEIWIERRPNKGLLGGTLGFPTSAWVDISHAIDKTKTRSVNWIELAHMLQFPMDFSYENIGTVKHSFTHFHLALHILQLHSDTWKPNNEQGTWMTADSIKNEALPTLMAKVRALALDTITQRHSVEVEVTHATLKKLYKSMKTSVS